VMLMSRSRVTIWGREKHILEWIGGFFVIIFGIITICSYITTPQGGYLIPLPAKVKNILSVLVIIVGSILLAIWGERASVDPIKSVAMGAGLFGFGVVLLIEHSVLGTISIIVGATTIPIALYLIIHGVLEIICK